MRTNTKFRFAKTVLYSLKRRYGFPFDIYRNVSVSTDLETGIMTKVKRKIHIKRVIVLPTRQLRDFVYDLSYIAANKNFTYGGYFDVDDRRIIIDRKDLPSDFDINLNDWTVFKHKRYEIKEISDFEWDRAIGLIVHSVEGAPVEEIFEQDIVNTLKLQEVIDASK